MVPTGLCENWLHTAVRKHHRTIAGVIQSNVVVDICASLV